MTTERMGRAVLELVTDDRDFNKNLDAAEQRAKSLGERFKQVGTDLKAFGSRATQAGTSLSLGITVPVAAAVGGLVALATQTAKTGDDIAKNAREAGLSAGEYQELTFALGMVAKVTSEDVTRAFGDLTNRIGKAATGTKTQVEALQALGFTQAEIASGTIGTGEAFSRLSLFMQSNASAATKARVAGDLLGTTMGRKLGGALQASGAQVDALRQRARDLGIVMSQDALDASEKFNDAVSEITQEFKALGREIGAEVMPMITDDLIPFMRDTAIPTIRSMTQSVADAVKWFRSLSPEGQKVALAVTAIAVAAGPALIVIGKVTTAVGSLVLWSGKAMTAMKGKAAATTLAGNASAAAAPRVTLLSRAFSLAAKGAGIFGAAVAGWQIGKWISGLKLFGEAQMNIGESFEFGATKLFNWSRGIEASDADIETAILSRRKLAESTDGVSDAHDGASAAADETAEEIRKLYAEIATLGQTGPANLEKVKAKTQELIQPVRDLTLAFTRYVQVGNDANDVARDQLGLFQALPPSITSAAESLDAYNLVAAHGTSALLAHSAATKAANAELASMGMLLPNLAVASQGVSATVTKAAGGFSGIFSNLKTAATGSLGDLNSIFQAAFTGGGGALGAVKSFATKPVATITNMIPVVGPIISQFAGAIVAGFSKIGAGLKKIFGGVSEVEKQGRQSAQAFRDDLRSVMTEMDRLEVETNVAQGNNRQWAETAVTVKNAYLAAGRSGEEALAAVDRLWRAEKQGGDAVAQVIREIEGVMRTQLTPATEASGAALVSATTQAAVGFQEVRNAVEALKADAIGSGGLIQAVHALEIQMQTAAASGVDDFSFMTASIEALKARIKTPITIPVTIQWRGVEEAKAQEREWGERASLESILDIATAWLAENQDDTGRIGSALGVSRERLSQAGVPGFTEGAIVRKPTLAMVGEGGPEAWIPLDRLDRLTRPIVVQLVASGRKLAEVVVPEIPGLLSRRGLA